MKVVINLDELAYDVRPEEIVSKLLPHIDKLEFGSIPGLNCKTLTNFILETVGHRYFELEVFKALAYHLQNIGIDLGMCRSCDIDLNGHELCQRGVEVLQNSYILPCNAGFARNYCPNKRDN